MNQGGLFSGDSANVMRWLSVAGVIVGLLAAALIVWVLLRKPESRFAPAAKLVLLAGIFALPVMSMLMGNVVGFHNTKQSCGQCHTMDPWVNDMKDPKSTTLAATHFRNRWINENQCYTCHTGYGLAGNVKAKMSGLSHVTHHYITGVPKEIKIKESFPVATCLHCHDETPKYIKIDQHVDAEMKPKILKGELSCFECHASPHPRKKP